MTKTTILFADNNKEFLHTWKEFLEQEGYQVFPAFDPIEAEFVFTKEQIDLAVIDIRLVNNDDKNDFSGLNLAKYIAPNIPKIILTGYPTWMAVREALGTQLEGLSPAIDFVAKQDGPQTLLTAIRKVLRLKTRFLQTLDSLSYMLEDDYKSAREQAKVNFWASLVISVIGMIIILIGISLGMTKSINLAISSAISGIISEAIGMLFFVRADAANKRMDRYHSELVNTRRFDSLLAACDEMATPQQQDMSKKNVIRVATENWFGKDKHRLPQKDLKEVTEEE